MGEGGVGQVGTSRRAGVFAGEGVPPALARL